MVNPAQEKGSSYLGIRNLESWKAKVELQTGKKVKAARSDNAPEFKHIVDRWEREGRVQAECATIISSRQNGPAERAIQTSEGRMRTLLETLPRKANDQGWFDKVKTRLTTKKEEEGG